MNIFFSLRRIIWIVALFFICVPQNSFAAQLRFVVAPASDGATTLEVRIDPEDKNLNVVEGGVSLSGSIMDSLLVEVDTEGSVLSIWPTEPFYNKTEKVVRFVGGVPNGLTKEGLLFSVRLSSAVSGAIDISWTGVKTYLNDGKGTEESTSVKSLSLILDSKNNKASLIEEKNSTQDNMPEENMVFSGFNFKNNGTIILLIIILLSIIFYGYKKFIKN